MQNRSVQDQLKRPKPYMTVYTMCLKAVCFLNSSVNNEPILLKKYFDKQNSGKKSNISIFEIRFVSTLSRPAFSVDSEA